METTHQLVPLATLARRLRVTNRWLRAEAEAGRIPHIRAERRILVDPDEVLRVLAARAKETGAADAK